MPACSACSAHLVLACSCLDLGCPCLFWPRPTLSYGGGHCVVQPTRATQWILTGYPFCMFWPESTLSNKGGRCVVPPTWTTDDSACLVLTRTHPTLRGGSKHGITHLGRRWFWPDKCFAWILFCPNTPEFRSHKLVPVCYHSYIVCVLFVLLVLLVTLLLWLCSYN